MRLRLLPLLAVVAVARHASAMPVPCPPGMVPLPGAGGACIDRYEASIEVQYAAGAPWVRNPFNVPIPTTPSSAPGYPLSPPFPGQFRFRAAATAHGERPQAFVSQAVAKAACAAAGKHLCNATEWNAGCSRDGDAFPYGATFRPGACNTGQANPVPVVFGPNAGWTHLEMLHPVLVSLPNTLAGAGTFPNCTTPARGGGDGGGGTFDQAGNMDEWIDETTSEGHGVFRGGYFVDDVINGAGCAYRTTAHAPDYNDYSLGFRCCL